MLQYIINNILLTLCIDELRAFELGGERNEKYYPVSMHLNSRLT